MGFTDKFDPEDFYMTEEGYIVFTEKYHLKRGYCCQSRCRHCPWKEKKQQAAAAGRKKNDKWQAAAAVSSRENKEQRYKES